ncbi:MAG: hypothetical protein IT303_14415 [Dehalococcoidia bacterium]|nr:hypothetical protein [Dehalococcoidia bacterium]
MRVLCLLFPRLSIELTLRARPALAGRPFVLLAGHGADALVTATTAELTGRGLVPGMSAAEARSRAREALFAPDNAGPCLDELERVAVILRARTTPLVELGGRDHLFVDITRLASGPREEERLARRLAALASAWTSFAVRAGVASSRAAALEAARAARRGPQVYPALLDAQEPPIAPYRMQQLTAAVTFEPGANELAIRAAIQRLARKLDLVLAARSASARHATIRLALENGETREQLLRLHEPAHRASCFLDAVTRAASSVQGLVTLEVALGGLGPDVRVAPSAASSLRVPAGRRLPAAGSLRRAG